MRWVLSVITELAFLQLVSLRGAHQTSEPWRSCKQGIIQSASVGENLFLVCSCWQPRVGLWHNDDKWVSGDLHHNDSVRSLVIAWGPRHSRCLSWWSCPLMLTTWVWPVTGSVDWALVTWQIWWWWDCDSDWCLPPVSPARLPPLPCPVSASGAWPGLVRPPGPGRAPTEANTEAGASQCGTRVSCARSVTSSSSSLAIITVISVTGDPSSLRCHCGHPGPGQECQEDTSSPGHPDNQTRLQTGGRSRLWLSDSEIIPLVG